MSTTISWRICVLCRQSVSPKCILLTRTAITQTRKNFLVVPLRLLSTAGSAGGGSSGSGKSLEQAKRSSSLAEPLSEERSGAGLEVDRRSADPDNELKEYIEYSKISSWHAAVGRKTPRRPRWKYERLVIGVCMIAFLVYIFIRPENSIDEQFGMDEFGKGLFRPNPAMEHHIAATIQAVESRGGDATLYRNQLKILLKEKELGRQQQQKTDKKDLKYDPKIHDVKY